LVSEYEEYRDYYENNVDSGFDFMERLPGWEWLEQDERQEAFELFNAGFLDDGNGTREDFFEFYGMTEDEFPWDEWREWMGYE
jgi:hypothetical protein